MAPSYHDEGNRVIEDRDGADAVSATYVFGNGIDEILTMDRGGQTYYFHTNAQGSITEIADSTGAIVERYEYDAYGAITIFTAPGADGLWQTADDVVSTDSAIGNRYTYTGREYEPESGLYYYRARFYDPATGRFLQRDPAGEDDLENLYAYVNNSPAVYVDPMGLEEWETGAVDPPFFNKQTGRWEQWREYEFWTKDTFWSPFYAPWVMKKKWKVGPVSPPAPTPAPAPAPPPLVETSGGGGSVAEYNKNLPMIDEEATHPLGKPFREELGRLLNAYQPIAEAEVEIVMAVMSIVPVGPSVAALEGRWIFRLLARITGDPWLARRIVRFAPNLAKGVGLSLKNTFNRIGTKGVAQYLRDYWFRAEKGEWKISLGKGMRKLIERWHFHVGLGGKELMQHHLPYEFKSWFYNLINIIRR